jgi:hypothetical protein
MIYIPRPGEPWQVLIDQYRGRKERASKIRAQMNAARLAAKKRAHAERLARKDNS